MKWQVNEIKGSLIWHINEIKCWWMTGWWNDRLMKWQLDKMTGLGIAGLGIAGWWNGRLRKWQVEDMTGWWKNNNLMKWQV